MTVETASNAVILASRAAVVCSSEPTKISYVSLYDYRGPEKSRTSPHAALSFLLISTSWLVDLEIGQAREPK